MTSTIPARATALLGYAVGGAGIFLATSRSATEALDIVTLLTVGGVGICAFVRHVVFARSDAARLGWSAEGGSNFQLEVGFANLAFGAAALFAYFGDWGTPAEVAVTFGYGLYLGQAALLHLHDYFRAGERSIGRLVSNVLAHFAMSGVLIYVALNAAEAASLAPF